jgi:restriction system protein
MALWMVRAGKTGQDEDLALENGVVVVGWSGFPDLSTVKSRDEMLALHEKILPDKKRSSNVNLAGQAWTFKDRIKEGDWVALPLKTRGSVAVGKITGPYEFRSDLDVRPRHARRVAWLNTDIPRTSIDIDILHSLGAFMTVCRIERNNAEARLIAVAEHKSPPPIPEIGTASEQDADTSESQDLEEYARDLITKHVGRNFVEHDLTRLVAALIRTQGYETRESPAGPDGGVDIVAGRGSLGFESPRLCVQVKSSAYTLDVKPLRELQGVMKSFGADQGLLVSWGGYKQSVHSEARRLFFEIRLWDSKDLIAMLLRNYEALPDDFQAEIPLKRIWTLVPDEPN